MKARTDAELRSIWLPLIAPDPGYFSMSESETLKQYYEVRLRPDEPGNDRNGVYHPADEAGYHDPEHHTIWINVSCIHEVRSLLLHEALPGRASGYPTGPPTDPYVRNERIRFLGNQSFGTSLAHHCAALHSQSDVVDDPGYG